MNLSSLKPAQGSVRKNKRIGRGQGSGRGGTSTRGHKGAKSRSGYSRKEGFEGGQMPLQRRVPKFGFNNPNKIINKVISTQTLLNLSEKLNINKFGLEEFVNNGLMSKTNRVKILSDGELTKPLEITAHAFSKTAVELIEKSGGKATVVNYVR